MMKPGWIQTKQIGGFLSAGRARGGREVTGSESTVGSRPPLDSSPLVCLTGPSAQPAMIDGTVRTWKPSFSVTESALPNNSAGDN